MEKDFKIGLVMQSSGIVGSVFGGSGSKYLPVNNASPLCLEGRKVYGTIVVDPDGANTWIHITDKYDMERILALNLDLENLDGVNPDDLYQFGVILQKYNEAGCGFVILAADLGSIDACLNIGINQYECKKADQEALEFGKKYLQKAADSGNACGKCWLGSYYAEGKGCKKNAILARKYLKEAAQVCPDAEQYLD